MSQRDYTVFDADIPGRAFDFRLFGRLLGWMRPHRSIAFWSGIAVVLASSLAVLGPVITSRVVIDGILYPTSGAEAPSFGMSALVEALSVQLAIAPLYAACVVYGALIAAWAVLMHVHRLLLSKAVLRTLRDLRHDLFSHLEHRPASFFDRVAVGRVMTRVSNDVEVLFQLLTGMGVLLGEFVPFIVALGIMFSIAPDLSGFLLLTLPVVGLATYLFRRATRVVYRAIRSTVSTLNQNLQENLSGVRVVQLYNREERNLARYMDVNGENLQWERTAIRLETIYGPFLDTLVGFGLGFVLWYGGRSVFEGAITLGSVVLFSQYMDMLFRPIVVLGEQYNVLYRSMASGERILQALDWDEAVHDPETPVHLPERLEGRVEFRNLTFGYTPGRPVLHDVSFTIEPGEKIAIVGPTGSGKTTLIRLLGRFYDVEPGQVLLDGVDVLDVRARDLRRRVGVVLQDFHVFSGSVADNISLGDPDIPRERVEEAARLVHADGFIRELPGGYDAPLSERGQNLSHGQRQLLAFARVVAADPEILVLDEATASIDTETERLIQDALARITAGRTSILIAHRLRTIREADRIVVLHHGRVREIGTHDELLELGGLYATLHALQFQDTAA